MNAISEQIVAVKRTCEPLVKPDVRTLSQHEPERKLRWRATAEGVVGLSRVVYGLDQAGKPVVSHNVTDIPTLPRSHEVLRRTHEQAALRLAEEHGLAGQPATQVSHYASARELRSQGIGAVTKSYEVPACHVPLYLYAADILTRNSTVWDDGRPSREFNVYIDEDADPDFGNPDAIAIFHQGAGQRSAPHFRWQQFDRLTEGAVVAFDHRYKEGYPVDEAYARGLTAIDEHMQFPEFAEDAPVLHEPLGPPSPTWRGTSRGNDL